MNLETLCLHAGYTPQNGEPRVIPIVQSTTFKYESTRAVQQLFDLEVPGFFYSRLANPTVDYVEKKLAALEGGVGAMCTSSGQAASFISLLTICKAGDHVISASSIYGGTFNLFAVTLKRVGIEVTFVDANAPLEELEKFVRPNTRAVFGETITNPAVEVLDLEKFAKLAHKHNLPLIVDNTFATPYLCRPIEFGADIVVHSTTKYLDGHAATVGGVIVDSGKFDWAGSGKFPEFVEPDDSYHGLIYSKTFGNLAYIVKARVQLMRDLGCAQGPQAAFYVNLGLETLPLRMAKYCENALKVAKFLQNHPKVEEVRYPGLENDPYHELAQKYLPKGSSGVIAFSVKGGRDAGAQFIDALELVTLQVHVADIRSCVLHPATSTHRQLSDLQLKEAGITPGLIRFSVGLENVDDIIADVEKALDKVKV